MELQSPPGDNAAAQQTSRMLAALSFAVTVIAIGVPIWLKTTETYRAHIPHGEIATLQELPLQAADGFRIQLIADTAGQAQQLAEQLQRQLPDGCSVSGRAFVLHERQALASVSDLDSWSAADAVSDSEGCEQLRVLVRADWTDIRLTRYCDTLVSTSVPMSRLADVLRPLLFGDDSSDVATRRMRISPEYNLLISLVEPEPAAKCDLSMSMVRQYLAPALDRHSALANISIQTQHIYHGELGVSPQRDSDIGHFWLSEQQLPLVITPLESRLGSAVAGTPIIHFVIYVPPVSRRPLHIRSAVGETNVFLSAGWGGVQIYNPATGDERAGAAARRVSSVILSQLRQLLGARPLPADAWAQPIGGALLRRWQLVAMRRQRTVENVRSARANLASVASLLEQIHNMVISDEVSAAVVRAVAGCRRAAQLLRDGGRDTDAYASSCGALADSERALFDPSMLALLYFPDDQKYAVYIPLFLPVSIPVLASLRTLWTWLVGRHRKTKSD